MVRQGGSYIVEKKGAKPNRVEWTRTPAEAKAEAEARKKARAKPAAKAAPKAPPATSQNGSDAK